MYRKLIRIHVCFLAVFLGHGVSFPPMVDDLSPFMEIGVHQPVNGGCYPLGASIAPFPELVLYVEESILNDEILTSSLKHQSPVCKNDECRGWVEFCSVVDKKDFCGTKIYLPKYSISLQSWELNEFSVLSQITPPPIIFLETPGCHQFRFEMRGGVEGVDDDGGSLLRQSNDIVFEVTPRLECSASSLCPSQQDVFSTEGVYQFNPISLNEHDGTQLLGEGFEGEFVAMSLVSDSPKHHDVILSNSMLLEMSRRDSNSQQKSLEPVLVAQDGTSSVQHFELCIGLQVRGYAQVSDQAVEVTKFKNQHDETLSTCLTKTGSSKEEKGLSNQSTNQRWRSVVTPPQSTNQRACSSMETSMDTLFDKCIVMELVSDGLVDYVNITFPHFMWEEEVTQSESRGLVVAVQAWLEVSIPLTRVPAKRLLSIRPVEVVLSPMSPVNRIIQAEEIEANSQMFEHDDLVLVMCRWSEDVEWVRQQPYRVIVYDKKPPKEGKPGKHTVSRNIGGEASAFLKFIIDYYDQLPPRMLFLHSHRWAYHQEDIAILLANIAPISSQEYCNINRVAWGHKEDQEQCWLRHHWNSSCEPSDESGGKGGWLKPWLGELPRPTLWKEGWTGPHLIERCCAQFLVSRDLIRSRPLGFYRHILAQIYARVHDNDSNKTGSSRHYGLLLEWLWHVIFSQPASMLVHDKSLSRSFDVLGPNGVLTSDRIVLDRPECVSRKRTWVELEKH